MKETREQVARLQAKWGVEARVWVVTSSDVPGLAYSAASESELFEKANLSVGALLEANSLAGRFDAYSFDFVGRTAPERIMKFGA